MKKSVLVLFTVLTLSLTSCTSNDDLPNTQLTNVVFNQFCFGPEASDTIEVARGFIEDPQLVRTNVYTTNVIISDDNITNDMGMLAGAGSLVTFNFTGNSNFDLQSGLYTIANAVEVRNVTVSYSTTFDATNTINTFITIESGLVLVTPVRTGYLIEVDGEDANGVRFHGNYLGNLTAFN